MRLQCGDSFACSVILSFCIFGIATFTRHATELNISDVASEPHTRFGYSPTPR